jgi:leucyl-tRNA synthetase
VHPSISVTPLQVLHDVGVVSTKEPFKRLVNQGLILGPVEHTLFLDESDMPVSAELATVEPQRAVMKSTNVPLKMEKVEDVDVIKQGSSFVLVSNPSIKVTGSFMHSLRNPNKFTNKYQEQVN